MRIALARACPRFVQNLVLVQVMPLFADVSFPYRFETDGLAWVPDCHHI